MSAQELSEEITALRRERDRIKSESVSLAQRERALQFVTQQEIDDFRADFAALTKHQQLVLRCRAVGMSIPEIAEASFLAQHTIKGHTTHALKRLGLDAGNSFSRVNRASYLLGRAEAQG